MAKETIAPAEQCKKHEVRLQSDRKSYQFAKHYHLLQLPQRHLPSFNLIKVIDFLFVELSPTLLLCNSSMQSAKTHKLLQVTLLQNRFLAHFRTYCPNHTEKYCTTTFEVMSLYDDSSAEFLREYASCKSNTMLEKSG